MHAWTSHDGLQSIGVPRMHMPDVFRPLLVTAALPVAVIVAVVAVAPVAAVLRLRL